MTYLKILIIKIFNEKLLLKITNIIIICQLKQLKKSMY